MSSLFRKASKRKQLPITEVASVRSSSSASDGKLALAAKSAKTLDHRASTTSAPPSFSSTITNAATTTTTFANLGLCPPLVSTCRKLGFVKPTPVQRAIIPRILSDFNTNTNSANNNRNGNETSSSHLLVLSATGSGKTAAFALPLLHLLSHDPYGIYALIITPTRELAKQIQQQVLALGCGSGWKITVALIVGGEDSTRQSLELDSQPNFVVGTPGRVADLCRGGSSASGSQGRGMYKPNFTKVKFVVLDEADRLLHPRSGFERDVAEILQSTTTTTVGTTSTTTTTAATVTTGEQHQPQQQNQYQQRMRRDVCRTLLFSATLTRSLKSLEEMAGAGMGRLPLTKVVIREDGSSWETEEKDETNSAGEVNVKEKKKQKVGSQDADTPNSGAGSDGDDSNNSKSDASEGDKADDDHGTTPHIPAGLRQEYIFMPSRVREAYLLCAIRTLMTNGGRGKKVNAKTNAIGTTSLSQLNHTGSGWNNNTSAKNVNVGDILDGEDDEDNDNIRVDYTTTAGKKSRYPQAQSTIIFVPTCERCAHVSGILTELGIQNVALHSLLSQNRRLASLGTFQSQRVRVLVATDVASRGLDIPEVDLVINAELPRRAVDYVHRVGRTARAGRRGRAISLVGEQDVDLVHEAERITGRSLEKCAEVTDDMAVRLLGPVAKASRLTKMKLLDIGFDELVAKHRERKRRDRRRREKAERAARKAASAKMHG